MCSLLKLRLVPQKGTATFSIRTCPEVPSKKADRPLDFWYIKAHDRGTLISQIIPYMAMSLQQEHLLQIMLGQHSWAEEMISSKLEGVKENGSVWLQMATTAFWADPVIMVSDLLKLTRLWFYTLLRYTYRWHFFEGGERSKRELDFKRLCTNHLENYFSALTKDEIQLLTHRPDKYGASFYRRSYKDTKTRLEWTSYAERIRKFSQSFGLTVFSDDPECNIRDLRRSLSSIICQRKVQIIEGDLAKNTVLVRNLKKHVTELEGRVASDTGNNNNTVQRLEEEVREMSHQFQNSRPRAHLQDPLLQRDKDVRAHLEKLTTAYEDRLKRIGCSMLKKNEISTQLIRSIRSDFEQHRREIDRVCIREKDSITADALVLCRWLLEHLPTQNLNQDRLNYRWRQFWGAQWVQCKERKRKSHPLWELTSNERYNKVGLKLYSTLSNRIHSYGHRRGEQLDPDVQRVVDVIRPVHYDSSGRINLEAERKRWTD